MACEDRLITLSAYADGELGPAERQELETHLQICPACWQELDNLRTLHQALQPSDKLRFSAPTGLRTSIQASLAQEAQKAEKLTPQHQTKGFAPWLKKLFPQVLIPVLSLSTLILLGLLLQPHPGPDINDELVSDHLRSLMAAHLTDIPSSDHKVVAPWLQGRLPFAPPVPDLKPRGFTLLGGRADYLEAKPAAALVYRQGQHVINLFLLPQASSAAKAEHPDEVRLTIRQDYRILHWHQNGMRCWAVSDLDEAGLRTFAKAFQQSKSI